MENPTKVPKESKVQQDAFEAAQNATVMTDYFAPAPPPEVEQAIKSAEAEYARVVTATGVTEEGKAADAAHNKAWAAAVDVFADETRELLVDDAWDRLLTERLEKAEERFRNSLTIVLD